MISISNGLMVDWVNKNMMTNNKHNKKKIIGGWKRKKQAVSYKRL